MLLLSLLLACSGDTRSPTDAVGDDSAVGESGPLDDSGGGGFDACEAPAALPDDPLTQVGQRYINEDAQGGFFVELIDLEVEGDRVFAVGQGGLMIYDVSDPSAPTLLGVHASERQQHDLRRYHRLELLGEGLIAVAHREEGLTLVDVSDPGATAEVSFVAQPGLEGLAAFGDDLLAVTVRGDGLRVYDVSDPANPRVISRVTGFEAPWEMSPVVDGWSYVADNTLGVVPVDLRDPNNPRIGAPVSLEGPTLHVAVDGDHLYASQGSYGVSVLNRADPAAPTVVGQAQPGGSSVMASASEGWLWVVDHEAVSVFDVRDPSAPVQRGHEITEQFALAVRAEGDRAWVGDWNILSHWALHPEVLAGELDLSTDFIALPTQGGETTVQVFNRGAAALSLAGATVSDPGVFVTVSDRSVPIGGSVALTLRWAGAEGLDATLCLASNDPDQPTLQTPVIAGDFGSHVGRPAPDFHLFDLDNQPRDLSDQLGHPVLLVYFATW